MVYFCSGKVREMWHCKSFFADFILTRRPLMVISLEIFDYVFLAESTRIVQHTSTQGIIAFVLGFRRKIGYGCRRAGRYPIRDRTSARF